MKNKSGGSPAYAVKAVGNALTLLTDLREAGELRVVDVSRNLGVAASTAHRLLTMLVHHGFAIRTDKRTYVPGPALTSGATPSRGAASVRAIALPILDELANSLGETANLMLRVGTHVRFIASAEGPTLLRVSDRQGTLLPARFASGGKAMLAQLSPEALRSLYAQNRAEKVPGALTEKEFADLMEELATVRRIGYAQNIEETEEGVSAIGIPVRFERNRSSLALSVATPSLRFEDVKSPEKMALLVQSRDRLEAELARSYDLFTPTTK